jgi:hypothetical protein
MERNLIYGFGISMQIQEVFFCELKLYEQLVKMAEKQIFLYGTEVLITDRFRFCNYDFRELLTTYKWRVIKRSETDCFPFLRMAPRGKGSAEWSFCVLVISRSGVSAGWKSHGVYTDKK